ncbi:MAG: uracil-DNA glycosylase family protein, partial [Flavobacteriales bacterium]
RENTAGSHQNKGWEQFTDQIISTISKERKDLVFLLWGKFAQNKAKLIDKNKHHILMSSHPSPLSSYRGFLGCKHFSECNNILKRDNKTEINWQL